MAGELDFQFGHPTLFETAAFAGSAGAIAVSTVAVARASRSRDPRGSRWVAFIGLLLSASWSVLMGGFWLINRVTGGALP